MEPDKRFKIQGQGTIKIQTQSPYERLDVPTTVWLTNLKQMWLLLKKSDATIQMLYNFFSNSPEPYKAVLQITISSGDFYSGKQNSLAFNIMKIFSTWVETQERLNNQLSINSNLKLDAFDLITKQKNQAFTDLVIKVYKMEEDKEMFIECIRQLVASHSYKEACNCAVLLKLHKHFKIEDFLIPLVFQDKYAVAETFLEGSKKHQLELAKFLDDMIEKRSITAEAEKIAWNLNIQEAKIKQLYYKPLSKLLARMIKTFDIPSTVCPNLIMKKQKGALQFLLQRRYINKAINDESWVEMALEAVGNDEKLQEELIDGVAYYGDLKEALSWAERFGTPQESWPYWLKEYNKRQKTESPSEFEENWDEPTQTTPEMNFHRLNIPESQIVLIDSPASFSRFLDDMNKDVSVVGFDAEWKPTFGFSKRDLSLIQVATCENAYILDVISLSSVAPSSLWERFASEVFGNLEIIKLGFGLAEDLVLLKETLRKFQGIKISDLGFLDMVALKQTLVYDYNFVFPFNEAADKSSKGLSSLIELCFGEKLDKSDQFSNWENRPLRKSQIIYAALDAYCLLEAYNCIVKECEAQMIPLTEIINVLLTEVTTKNSDKKKKKNFRGKWKQEERRHTPPSKYVQKTRP